ncbi:MAG: hypothetical protein PHC91_03740, partial [Eubacteriales bacterium]|nr:hypothetical protein [Eubacteriales bacterium]
MLKQLQSEVQTFNGRRSLIIVLIIIAAAFLLTTLLPDDPADFGPAALIPAFFLILYIFATKRILEALTLSSIIGFIMVIQGDTLGAFSGSLLEVMMSEDIAWLIIVCG